MSFRDEIRESYAEERIYSEGTNSLKDNREDSRTLRKITKSYINIMDYLWERTPGIYSCLRALRVPHPFAVDEI